ncbi:hypothetical protein HOLleu_30913 [Holothuria leucospilota]|uniref:Uncharacterized protein n=1 Tax=Holothuria leucospilota TaxID=206669 RepID=A0A9Q1GZK3_HOLLE|nr:hypothetical protein HOLleu_30913 [Holothuria leucospilota]
MYLQIGVNEVDRSMLRFLWRDLDDNKKPQVYEFCRLAFGLNACPFIAQKVSQHNGEVNKQEFPQAAETVLKSTYMDDSMDSVENEEKGVELYNQLSELWARAGMKARKWLSNSSPFWQKYHRNTGPKKSK